MNRLFLYLLIFSFTAACSPNTETKSNDPSELVIETDISTDGSGKVIVTAHAKNAIEFRFYMGDNGSGEPYSNQNGIYEHEYQTLGTYTIEVRAYGLSGRYIKKTKQIVVLTGDPVTTGDGYITPTFYEGMNLVWNDEFEGSNLNSNNWDYEIGDGCPNLCGWGNNELEYYRSQNCSVSDGVLTIEARKEAFQGREYTSGRIISRDLQVLKYGRVDIRALLPKGQGLWPALWMLGTNQPSIGWPSCGEIDIMEMIGGSGRENTVGGNVYWYDNGKLDFPGHITLDTGTFNDEFYVFTMIWDDTEIKWLVNDVPYHSISILGSDKAAFHKSFYFIMNVAVGGNWPGSPNGTTIFPTSMKVDYIRAFQKD